MLRKGLRDTEITGNKIRTKGSVVHDLLAIAPLQVTSPAGSMGPSHFCPFVALKTHLAGKSFATDSNMNKLSPGYRHLTFIFKQ